ncbi:MAG: DUF89 family protein [Oscillospiraceae bacterium]|nr:DUF89 family protein [Oscillospiraceae bacterium]
MKISEHCFPCLLKQVIKTEDMLGAENREEILREALRILSVADYSKSSPAVSGEIYSMLAKKTGVYDPYKNLKDYYNRYFEEKLPLFEEKITSFKDAVKFAILGNIVDFSAVRVDIESEVAKLFTTAESLEFAVDDSEKLLSDIKKANTVLYLGDNCGEICLDKLLIKQIKNINPDCKVYFAVRGMPAANDNTKEDALSVKMDELAEIIENGDCSLGTVLDRTSEDFRKLYHRADLIISKGQGNYESLSDEKENLYFLLMIKCPTIAEFVGVPERSVVCMKNSTK